MVLLNPSLCFEPIPNTRRFKFRETQIRIPKNPISIVVFSSSSAVYLRSKWKSYHRPTSHGSDPYIRSSAERTTNLGHNRSLKPLFETLNYNDPNSLKGLFKENGDLSNEQFWDIIRFLRQSSRSNLILQVFDVWTKAEKSRITELNYEKITKELVNEGLMKDAVSALEETKNHSLRPSSDIYNSLIHGFAGKGLFDHALFYLNEMEEIDLKPDTETYNGLVKAYGKYKMYNEMCRCVKNMRCAPDHVTYNLLIRELSRGGLLARVERMYQTLVSKRMGLQSSTLMAMLDAYCNFGIVDKMEFFYKKALNLRIPLKEDLVWKLARVYVDNYMFSRLDDLGMDLSSKVGGTNLLWCLRLLSHASVLSRKGMDSILLEMESDQIPWNVNIANIMLLAYLKMKDFKHFKVVISELPARGVKPDIVTVGILFDAFGVGFEGKRALNSWGKTGLLDEDVEMSTDSLVLVVFGKGHFLTSCEEIYSSFEPEEREKKRWTYRLLIDLVSKHKK